MKKIKQAIFILAAVALYLAAGFWSGVAEPSTETATDYVDMSEEDPFNPNYYRTINPLHQTTERMI